MNTFPENIRLRSTSAPVRINVLPNNPGVNHTGLPLGILAPLDVVQPEFSPNPEAEIVEDENNDDILYDNIGYISFLMDYLRMLFYVGGYPQVHGKDITPSNWQRILNKVVFLAFSVFSILNGVKVLKASVIYFAAKGGLRYFANIWLYFFKFLGKVYLFTTFQFKNDTFGLMLDAVEAVKTTQGNRKMVAIGFISLSVLSFMIIIFKICTFYLDWNDWSFSHLIAIHAFRNELFIFSWSTENFDNKSTKIFEKYWDTNEYSNAIILNAMTGIFLEFCGSVATAIYEETMLMVALTTNVLLTAFVTSLPIIKTTGENYRELFNKQLSKYTKTSLICKTINNTVGGLLKLFHCNLTLRCVLFLVTCLEDREISLNGILDLMKIAKACFAYWLAVSAAQKNKIFEDWLYDLHNCARDPSLTADINMVMNHMKSNNFGVGQDAFYVNIYFVYKILGAIFTYFVFLAKANKGDGSDS